MAEGSEIRKFVVGPIETNCYAVVSEGKCLVVDPGATGDMIASHLEDVEVELIVATHCHHDHVCGIRALKEATGAPWAISAADRDHAVEALERSSHVWPDLPTLGLEDPPEPDQLLAEGDVVRVGTLEFRVVACPGHTPGGIALIGMGEAAGLAFVGDTLFAGSAGRTDLAGGDFDQLMATLDKLSREISPDTMLLCGHGPETTMATELATNPFYARR